MNVMVAEVPKVEVILTVVSEKLVPGNAVESKMSNLLSIISFSSVGDISLR
jgi:hypothetical protein